ncbi:uncharacterized protein LOC108670722 [Hyalella azteca]|uniref:Uncharacterized protein LOC108670722 n=1 Tax=Hyalella azteca TaxID=294128 RepID=A0A8B7NJ73_HYAAZ|nr:uncharacterized protein LOC108670722 [Hyalella azteca]
MAKSILAFLCIAVIVAETVLAQPVQVADSPLVVADEAEAPALVVDELSVHEFSLDEFPALRQFLDETAVDDQKDFGVQEDPNRRRRIVCRPIPNRPLWLKACKWV